ncbi:MAG TPA: hypothetical protein VK669_08355 [Candidatus Limnocylindrales bacterium]|nr:hypothetical protein [Candidatus Limnocylindrales bacterium]
MRLPNGAIRYDRYDLIDRLRQQDFPDGSWLRYGYEGRRLARLEHSSGEHVGFAHDDARSSIDAERGGIRTTLRADAAGFPESVTLTIDGFTWETRYAYDAEGRPTAIRYPGASAWTRLGNGLAAGERVYVDVERIDEDRSVARYANGVAMHETLRDGRVRRLELRDARGRVALELDYAYDAENRIAVAGDARAEYDGEGRLRAWTTPRGARSFAHDPAPPSRYGERAYAYDELGRRSAERERLAQRRYRYDMYGALERVELEDGTAIGYRYDAFGRLVARDTADGTTYYLPDLDGRRLAEADASGTIVRTYLWLGGMCAGVVDGIAGEPLARSLHQVHAGTVAAVGGRDGAISLRARDDPFGADHAVEDGLPGFGGLFGEPATGLLFAGSRWLDPRVAQFITPDSWAGVDPLAGLPPGLRARVRDLPGGPARTIGVESAYAWCDGDPVNRRDPYGHHWANIFWTIPSALLWGAQLTSLALQIFAVNILFAVGWFLIGGLAWAKDSYWEKFPFNIPAPVFSSQFGSFALVLNGLLTYNHGRNFTLGNVIFGSGTEWADVEAKGKRDLVIAAGASAQMTSATKERFVDQTRLENDKAALTAHVATLSGGRLGGGTLDNLVVTAPAAPAAGPAVAVGDVLTQSDWISIAPPAGTDERRRIDRIAGATIELDGPALPAAFNGVNVTVKRLDLGLISVSGTGVASAARTVRFVSGNAVHLWAQLQERFAEKDAVPLKITEFVPDGRRAPVRAPTVPAEFPVLRKPDDDWTGFAVNDVVKIDHGSDTFVATVSATNGKHELVIEPPLPSVALPLKYDGCKVRLCKEFKVLPGTQSLAGGPTMLAAGKLPDGATELKRGDVLEAKVAPAPAPPASAVQLRVVKEIAVLLTVDAIGDGSLQNQDLKLERLQAGPKKIVAAMKGADANTFVTNDDATDAFKVGRPVRITKGADTGFGIVKTIDKPSKTVTIADSMDKAKFPDAAAVTVEPMNAGKSWTPDQLTAPGATQLVIQVGTSETPNGAPRAADALWLHLASGDGGVVRTPTGEATIRATLDSALPATHAANMTVRQLRPTDDGRRKNVSAPAMFRQVTGLAAADFGKFAVNDFLLLDDGTRSGAIVKIASADPPPAGNLHFDAMAEAADFGAAGPAGMMRVAASGATISPVTLDEARVLVPDDPTKQFPRRKALQEHELRHSYQGAVWGPMFISLPIPWLIHLGASLANRNAEGSQFLNWIKLGGIDMILFELIFPFVRLGQKKQVGVTIAKGTASSDKTSIVLDADTSAGDLANFSAGTRISVSKTAIEGVNLVDKLDTATRTLTLHGPLEGQFNGGDAVEVAYDPMEEWRRKVTQYTSLDAPEILFNYFEDKIPAGWWQLFTAPLKRDAWLPFLGWYFMGLYLAHGDEYRNPVEQDAAFHSGDLYTSIARSSPREVLAGEFTRVFRFFNTREYGDNARFNGGLADVAVELPAAISAGKVRGADRLAVEITQDTAVSPIEVAKGDGVAKRFFATQRVRVEGSGKKTLTVLESVDGKANKLFLVDPLDPAMGDGSDVTVSLIADEADVPDAVGDLRTVSGTIAGDTFTVNAGASIADKGAFVRVLPAAAASRDDAVPVEIKDPAAITFTKAPNVAAGNATLLASRVGFRENRRIKLAPLVENAAAFIFRATRPGLYTIKVLGGPTQDVVWHLGFGTNLVEIAQIVVSPVELHGDHSGPYYETERVAFTAPAGYRFALAAGDRGTLAADSYVAPKLNPGETSYVAKFDLTRHYDPGDAFFKKANRPEQGEDLVLEAGAADLVCQQSAVRFLKLDGAVKTPPAVKAGGTSVFTSPLRPSDSEVRPVRPPGATTDGFLTFDAARPTNVTYHAPAGTTPAADVAIDLYFGEGANRATKQKVTVTVHVTP